MSWCFTSCPRHHASICCAVPADVHMSWHVSSGPSRAADGPAAAVGDVDGDGADDLFVGGGAGQPGVLWLRRGDRFDLRTPDSFAAHAAADDVAAIFLDADGDGDLDLYVGSGGYTDPASPALRDRLYLGDGAGGFTEAGEVCSEYEEDYCTYHILGTDYLGRDTLSRIMWGARTTIGISFAATVLAYIVGVIFGIAAAVGGSKLDMGFSRVNDAFISIPHIMLGLVVIAAVGSSIPILIVTAGLIYATTVFRISRALALDVMVSDFVEAARARGEGLWWIIRREILPNIAMPLATDFGLRLVFIILFISSLSFLGLGVQPPISDWGSMVRENLQGLAYGSLAPMAPSIAIATLTISINLIVDDVSAHAGGRLAKRMI